MGRPQTGQKFKMTTYVDPDVFLLVKQETRRARITESEYLRNVLIKQFGLDAVNNEQPMTLQ